MDNSGMKNIFSKLLEVQAKLNCPKNQHNSFGNYNFRSCEDILEAVKPLLKEQNLCLTLSDEIVNIGQRFYVKATATLIDIEAKEGETTAYETTAYAREEESKKGNDASQITGSASSYARKYALNGLFNIDDTKDADVLNNGKDSKPVPKPTSQPKKITEAQRKRLFAIANGNNEVAKRVLARYKYEKTEDILMKDYGKICDEIEIEINS